VKLNLQTTDFLLLVIYKLIIIYITCILIYSLIAAVDDDNIPVIIPRAIPQTDYGWELYEKGYERRLRRLDQRQELISLVNSSRKGTANVPEIHIDPSPDSDE
jgi:hypothetical protein